MNLMLNLLLFGMQWVVLDTWHNQSKRTDNKSEINWTVCRPAGADSLDAVQLA